MGSIARPQSYEDLSAGTESYFCFVLEEQRLNGLAIRW